MVSHQTVTPELECRDQVMQSVFHQYGQIRISDG